MVFRRSPSRELVFVRVASFGVFNLLFEMALEMALFCGGNIDSDVWLDKKLPTESMQTILCYSSKRLVPSKCKMLFQNWIGWDPILALPAGQILDETHRFHRLGSCFSSGDRVWDGVSSCIQKAHLEFTNLRCLWRRHEIRLFIRRRVYTATLKSILNCSTKTQHLMTTICPRAFLSEHIWLGVLCEWLRSGVKYCALGSSL